MFELLDGARPCTPCISFLFPCGIPGRYRSHPRARRRPPCAGSLRAVSAAPRSGTRPSAARYPRRPLLRKEPGGP